MIEQLLTLALIGSDSVCLLVWAALHPDDEVQPPLLLSESVWLETLSAAEMNKPPTYKHTRLLLQWKSDWKFNVLNMKNKKPADVIM